MHLDWAKMELATENDKISPKSSPTSSLKSSPKWTTLIGRLFTRSGKNVGKDRPESPGSDVSVISKSSRGSFTGLEERSQLATNGSFTLPSEKKHSKLQFLDGYPQRICLKGVYKTNYEPVETSEDVEFENLQTLYIEKETELKKLVECNDTPDVVLRKKYSDANETFNRLQIAASSIGSDGQYLMNMKRSFTTTSPICLQGPANFDGFHRDGEFMRWVAQPNASLREPEDRLIFIHQPPLNSSGAGRKHFTRETKIEVSYLEYCKERNDLKIFTAGQKGKGFQIPLGDCQIGISEPLFEDFAYTDKFDDFVEQFELDVDTEAIKIVK